MVVGRNFPVIFAKLLLDKYLEAGSLGMQIFKFYKVIHILSLSDSVNLHSMNTVGESIDLQWVILGTASISLAVHLMNEEASFHSCCTPFSIRLHRAVVALK